MKIALITDTHYNFKKANKNFHDYFAKFYKDIFFPYLEENNIKTVIHLGDAFDNRKGIDYWALDWAKRNVYDVFKKLNIKVYSIVGNHDTYYKNTNEVNSIDILLDEYENIVKISKISYIDAIVTYCEENSIEIETVPKLIPKPLKEKLKCEATKLNFLKKTSRATLNF